MDLEVVCLLFTYLPLINLTPNHHIEPSHRVIYFISMQIENETKVQLKIFTDDKHIHSCKYTRTVRQAHKHTHMHTHSQIHAHQHTRRHTHSYTMICLYVWFKITGTQLIRILDQTSVDYSLEHEVLKVVWSPCVCMCIFVRICVWCCVFLATFVCALLLLLVPDIIHLLI